MRLLRIAEGGSLSLVEYVGSDVPKYAILSHTWGDDHDEISFRDFTEGLSKNKLGYRKLNFCARQAARDGLQFFWIDTCCIDKSSSSELQEAINSMFQWYRKAEKCYAYLADVSTASLSSQRARTRTFQGSRWFRRGWTLQELLAPISVDFFSVEGLWLGNRVSLLQEICEVTHISPEALQGKPLHDFSTETRLSWAKDRLTKREEDKAYSLLGIFNVYMPLIYGEGREHAFRRLQEEIEKSTRSFANSNTTSWNTASIQTQSSVDQEAQSTRNPFLRFRKSQSHRDIKPGSFGELASFKANATDRVLDLEPNSNTQRGTEVADWEHPASCTYVEATTHSNLVGLHNIAPTDDIDVKPLSERLAWFTNTKVYRNWARSEGGCISCRTDYSDAGNVYRANILATILPMSWETYPPRKGKPVVHLAYFNAGLQKGCTLQDFLLSVCYQLLVSTHQDVSSWLQTLTEVETLTRRQLLKALTGNLPSIGAGSLLDLMHFLLKQSQRNFHPERDTLALCVLKDIQLRTHPEFVDNLVKLQGSFKNVGLHIFITGFGWKPDSFLVVDEDTEYNGESLSRITTMFIMLILILK